jgi:hypothetical protein
MIFVFQRHTRYGYTLVSKQWSPDRFWVRTFREQDAASREWLSLDEVRRRYQRPGVALISYSPGEVPLGL